MYIYVVTTYVICVGRSLQVELQISVPFLVSTHQPQLKLQSQVHALHLNTKLLITTLKFITINTKRKKESGEREREREMFSNNITCLLCIRKLGN